MHVIHAQLMVKLANSTCVHVQRNKINNSLPGWSCLFDTCIDMEVASAPKPEASQLCCSGDHISRHPLLLADHVAHEVLGVQEEDCVPVGGGVENGKLYALPSCRGGDVGLLPDAAVLDSARAIAQVPPDSGVGHAGGDAAFCLVLPGRQPDALSAQKGLCSPDSGLRDGARAALACCIGQMTHLAT
jgi:hypothetical protein